MKWIGRWVCLCLDLCIYYVCAYVCYLSSCCHCDAYYCCNENAKSLVAHGVTQLVCLVSKSCMCMLLLVVRSVILVGNRPGPSAKQWVQQQSSDSPAKQAVHESS